MSKQRQKEKKKKNRERQVRKMVLERREHLRAERKKQKAEQLQQQQQEQKWEAEYEDTIMPPSEFSDMTQSQKDEEVRKRLQHNMQLLQALEDEYLAEQEARQKLNEKLEQEGHESAKDKLDAMHKAVLEMQGNSELNTEIETEK